MQFVPTRIACVMHTLHQSLFPWAYQPNLVWPNFGLVWPIVHQVILILVYLASLMVSIVDRPNYLATVPMLSAIVSPSSPTSGHLWQTSPTTRNCHRPPTQLSPILVTSSLVSIYIYIYIYMLVWQRHIQNKVLCY
jgi:hypothetical protein